jgi:hypothetical protein
MIEVNLKRTRCGEGRGLESTVSEYGQCGEGLVKKLRNCSVRVKKIKLSLYLIN